MSERAIGALASELRAASSEGTLVEIVGGGRHAGRGGRIAAGAQPVRAPAGVVAHEPGDLTCTVLGGTTLCELDTVLAGHGQELPWSGLPPDATVGGVISCGLSSRRRLRVGLLRDRVLQVKVVTGDGRVVKAGGPTVKNVSGFDLCRLMCGSFGTLGVIAEVIVKVTPRPAVTGWYVTDDPDARAAANVIWSTLYRPAAVEVWPDGRTAVLFEGHASDVGAEVAQLPPSFQEVPEVGPLLGGDIEATASPSASADLLRIAPGASVQVGVSLASWPAGTSLTVHEQRRGCEELGGRLHTLVPLDGVEPWGTPPPPAAIAISRRIKHAFDPAGILNRGRMPWLD